jgi:endo-1,4-beta-xylanase
VAWDVVNEAIENAKPYNVRTDTPFYLVDDFICKSFKWAHEADPDTQLFYNDYGHSAMDGWEGGRGDVIFDMIKDMKKRGCPIHGVGFQLHQDINFLDRTNTIGKNLRRYDKIGIKVHFTEVDVKCDNCGMNWSAANLEKQEKVYRKLL